MSAHGESPQQRVEWLRAEIRRHDHLYYALDRPEIDDAAYDALYRELVALESAHPELDDPTSPTKRVPGAVAEGFASFAHPVPMVSIENVTTEEELRDWETSTRAFLKLGDDVPVRYSVEPKIDGASLELIYERGEFKVAATRGDGTVGEDVTSNVRTVKSVPLRLDTKKPPAYVCVRGEAYVRKDDFARLNTESALVGEKPYANPRNYCAGSLRMKDPKIPASRPIRFLAYSIPKVEGLSFASHGGVLDALKAWGFPVSDRNAVVTGLNAVVTRFRTLESDRDALPFEIDGVVLKVDDLALQDRLGMRSRSPRWAKAWKFTPRSAVTRLKNIAWSVGRTGVVSPVAELEPVGVGGVTVSNSTLHNADELKRLGVKVGDYVVVERAGDVIPKITGFVPERRDEATVAEPEIPTGCPSCATPLVRDAEKVALRCPNPDCRAQVKGRILHFLSRGGMDVEGLGDELVSDLVEKHGVRGAADLWFLPKATYVSLYSRPRVEMPKSGKRAPPSETAAQNIVDRLQAAKAPRLDKFLYALGIPEVGERGAKILSDAFPTVDALAAATPEALDELHEVGPAMAKTVADWFREPRNVDMLARLHEAGISPVAPAPNAGGAFSGLTVVFTGTLPTLSRDEAKAIVEAQGGRVGSSISKNTNLLVAGEEAGSKLKKAKEAGVETVDEAEFLRRAGR